MAEGGIVSLREKERRHEDKLALIRTRTLARVVGERENFGERGKRSHPYLLGKSRGDRERWLRGIFAHSPGEVGGGVNLALDYRRVREEV